MNDQFVRECVDNILNNPYNNSEDLIDEIMRTFPLDDINNSGCNVPVDGLGPNEKVKVRKKRK